MQFLSNSDVSMNTFLCESINMNRQKESLECVAEVRCQYCLATFRPAPKQSYF